ncbi:sugar phosphate isomerase/epimerase [Cohnella sp. REN36]|uniref:sugar phosphate isomerase/epimerase family protein n=1 Tax=Cohnella sp. REN36 TaxID=2887347 RepID=UPI001D1550DE|nr:TIM barrel protein [Cohnella sp. REN36]MCC3373982.1 sugar phosphate isomerase/epimerase [Cohnella sp. REN36]
MSYLSVSTWSLHRLLGPLRWTAWDAKAGEHRSHEQPQPQKLTLLELPAELAARGYRAVEICHFHFPSVEASYLAQLRDAFANASISFDTLLLDYGDLTAEDVKRRQADFALMRRWIEIAAAAGAKQIRIVAGEAQPDDADAIRHSAEALQSLAVYGDSQGVRVITENFKSLTSKGSSCLSLLKQAGDRLGMITDFGNFSGSAKYEELAMILPHSVSVHAKAHYDEKGFPDVAEYVHCLDTVRASGFDGAYVLIYDGPGDMWAGLDRVKRLVEPYVKTNEDKVKA